MNRVLLIEDEEPAAKRLQKMIGEIATEFSIAENTVSVNSSIAWLQQHPAPDLIFSDIQLADGLSFDIFKSVDVSCPVIFTTAYDKYAIEAFKVNSIDYLLKPIKREELQAAIDKYRKTAQTKQPSIDINRLIETFTQQKQEYKTRFIVRYGEHIKTIHIDEVAYFNTEDKMNFLTNKEGRRYAIDMNLDNLEGMLNPHNFFRINRQFIVSIGSIAEMFAYSKSRVLIKLNPPCKHETIVSTERSGDFKLWLDDAR